MSKPVSSEILCCRCRAVLAVGDNRCRSCGAPTGQGANQRHWSESPWVILPLLFLILGRLAIPLLWRSRQFTPFWKTVLTVLVTGTTLFLCFSLYQIVQMVSADLQKLQGI